MHNTLGNKEANLKLRWLTANDHKPMYWIQWLRLRDMKTMGKDMYNPDTVEIADWMIRNRTDGVSQKRICFNPRAFCWSSGKSLFLKPVTVVNTLVTGPGDPLKEKFYFTPKHYILWLMKE